MGENAVPNAFQDRPTMVAGAGAALLAFALLELPHGYYQFLRVSVTGAALYLAYRLHRENQILPLLVAVAVGILFNPLYEIEFEQDDWQFIDAATSLAFGAYALWRLSSPQQRRRRFLAAGAILGAGAFIITAPSLRSAGSGGTVAESTSNYLTDDPLMGVNAFNEADAGIGYQPYFSDPPEIGHDNRSGAGAGDGEAANLLDHYLAPRGPRDLESSTSNHVLNTMDEDPDAIPNTADESEEE